MVRLVLNGPQRGTLWEDGRCSDTGITPFDPGFAAWCLQWLNDPLLWVAIAMTASPKPNASVRRRGHGRAGCRRPTRQAPSRYAPPATASAAVTSGANCQTVSASRTVSGDKEIPLWLRPARR
jgi:hypothetical protein